MEINTFRIILIIIISVVVLTIIIVGIIYLKKCIKKRKLKEKGQPELSISSTNETSQPSANISVNQNNLKLFSEKKYNSREVKINAFCECFLKPVKYDLIEVYNETCPIDLVKFNEDNYISVTKCHHGFHYDCIKKYLFENKKNKELKCPVCLSKLFVLDDNAS